MRHIEIKESGRPAWLNLFYFFLWVIVGLIPSQILSMYAVSPFFNNDVDFLGQVLSNADLAKNHGFGLTLFQGLSSLLAFLVVPLLYLKVVEQKNMHDLSQGEQSTGFTYLWVLALVFLSFPFMSWLVEWNENVTLPLEWKAFENWARERELLMKAYTEIMTNFGSTAQFILAFVVIALVAGLWEELVFRGIIQRLLFQWWGSAHAAIWVTAFVFSAIHFQFFGFFPRLLLGALFGYLYYWSKDLFVPILAHAINNGFTVVMMYLWQQKMVNFDIDQVSAVPLPSLLISLVLFSAAIYHFRKKCFTNFN